jgi:hypothetical protein
VTYRLPEMARGEMLVAQCHSGILMSENLHDSTLRTPRHCQGAGYVMTKIVKLEVGETKGFRQPAKPYRHGVGAQGWQDESVLIERTRETVKEPVQCLSHGNAPRLPVLGVMDGRTPFVSFPVKETLPKENFWL